MRIGGDHDIKKKFAKSLRKVKKAIVLQFVVLVLDWKY
jgi:hypothetical protein